jgi:hypothetical protein
MCAEIDIFLGATYIFFHSQQKQFQKKNNILKIHERSCDDSNVMTHEHYWIRCKRFSTLNFPSFKT